MDNHMMRRLLALALSAMLMLGSCSIAETVPAVGEDSGLTVQKAAVDAVAEPTADSGDEISLLADESSTYSAEPDGDSENTDSDGGATSDAAGDATNPGAEDADGARDPDAGIPNGAANGDADATDGAMDPGAAGEAASTAIEIEEICLPEKIAIEVGDDYQLAPKLLPEGAQGRLSYTVDNSEVATVDESGLLHGVEIGETSITVSAENGCSATCKISVCSTLPRQIVVSGEVHVLEGRNLYVQVQLLPENAIRDLSYIVADAEIAQVDALGYVHGIRPGTTQLIVTTQNGISASVTVVIEAEGAEFFEISDGVLTQYQGNAHYINVPDGVTAIGGYAFSGKDCVIEVNLPDSVRRIENGAFSNCVNLTNVRMHDGVTYIGERCFEGCKSLCGIDLSASIEEIGKSAFKGCAKLSSIDLPASLRTIGDTAFYQCGALTEIQLPDVTYIGSGAFSGTAIVELTVPGSLGRITTAFLPNNLEVLTLCEGITAIEKPLFVNDQPLRRIQLPASLTYLADGFMTSKYYSATAYGPSKGYLPEYFANTNVNYVPIDDVTVTDEFRIEDEVLVEYTGKGGRVVIPEQVTKIDDNVFEGRSDVTEVVFHDGITWIGYAAFSNCTGLTELRLPSGLRELGMYAFRGCTGLTHVEIPGSVRGLGGCFEECTALESAVLNEGVEVCGGFGGCVNLKRVQLPSTLKTLGGRSFFGCTALTQIEIPASVTYIGHEAFRDCTGITEIQLPAGLTSLGDGALDGCANLQSIRLPGKLKRINSSLFKNCSSLTSVTLPEGLYEISGGSFNGCVSLRELYVPDSVKEISGTDTISGDVFVNCPQLTVYGLKGTTIQKYCVDTGVPFKVLDADSASISFPEGNLTLGVGQTYTPEIRVDSMAMLGNVTFSSSSSRVTVNKTTGALAAKRTGTATITAKATSGAKASYKVTVKAAPKSIAFREKSIMVAVGEEFRLEYVLPSNTAASVTFSEESFFAVRETDEEGVYLATDPGVAKVKVTTHNGKSDTCTVTVVPKPTAVYVDRENIVLRQTRGDVIVPSVNPESICNAYAFTSSDPEIVTVDADGRLLGVNQGTAEIAVSVPSVPGLKATCRVTVIAPPPQISLAAEKITLGVNEKFDLNVGYITDEADYNAAFSCKSSNSKYVTVSAEGVVTAKRAGSAAITVTSADGVSAVCVVTVKRAPSSVKISPAKGNLAVGQTGTFKWTLSSGAAGSVRFESSDPAVLEVTDGGAAIAKAAGTAKVRVITYNGKTATSTITVHPEPESVTFTKNGDPMRFAIGMKGKLNAVLYPSNYGSYTFESSDPGVISVDAATGAYVVHSMGECDLTVTAYNGVSETRHAKVYVAPDYIKAVDTKLTLGVGEDYRMRIRKSAPYGQECEAGFSYRSSSTKVATVDENGVITAKKTGSATITATSFNGMKVSCKVTVKKAPTSLKLNATEIVLGMGEDFQLTASIGTGSCGGVVRYESSNGNLVYVDETGRIVARNCSGTVVVTASLYNGLSQSCTVHLDYAPSGLEFPVDTLEMYVGMKLDPQIQVKGGVCSSFKTRSSNASVAYMDSYGRIVAKKKGRAEIRVETYNGYGDTLYVTVASAPSKCYLDLPGTLYVGYLYNLPNYFRTSPQTNPWLTFASAKVSNDRAVILENETGVYLMPLEAGSFTVTVKSYNGKSVKKTLKAVESGQPIEPEISSPALGDAQLADYLGSWSLTGVCAEGMTFPPEMLDLQNSGVIVYNDWTEIIFNGEHAGVYHRLEGGKLLLLDDVGEEMLRCTLHDNGMLSLPLEEGVVLWYRRT